MTVSLLVIDMQQASFAGPAQHPDVEGLIQRINMLSRRVRAASGRVVFIQFDGPVGNPYHPDQPGWQLLPGLEIEANDLSLRKPGSDAFQSTDLEDLLGTPSENEIIVSGCDTEYCIDSTLRSAIARGYNATVPEDGHTCPDRDHLAAQQIITHHNIIWSTLGLAAAKCSDIDLPRQFDDTAAN